MRVIGRLYPEQYAPRWQYNFAAVLYAFVFASLVLLIVFAVQFSQSRSDVRDFVQVDIWNKADRAAMDVDDWFKRAETGINDIAQKAAAEGADVTEVDGDLLSLVRDTPGIRQAGFYLQGSVDSPQPRLVVYRRGSDRPGDVTSRRSEEDIGLVTDPAKRFRGHLDQALTGTSGWIAPVADELSESSLVPVVFPIKFAGETGEQASFIFAEVSLGTLSQVLSWTLLGEAGYKFLVDENFTFTVHAESKLDSAADNLLQATGGNQLKLDKLLANSPENGIDLISYENEIDGEPSFLTLHSLPTIGWDLGYIALESQVLTRSVATKQTLMRLTAAGLAVLFFLLIIVTRSYAGSLGGLWLLAVITGLLFTSGILVIWYLFASTPSSTEPLRVDLVDAIESNNEYLAAEFNGLESIDVNVGIALTSVEFTKLGSTIANADEAIISGFIWWTCIACPVTGFETGGEYLQPIRSSFRFPEAREVVLNPISSFNQGLEDTDVYEFSAIVSRDFQPAQYPFDVDDVSLRIWPSDFGTEILLVPDAADYPSLIQTDKPGLATDFKISGWITEGTYFSYDVVNYNTSFGLQQNIGTTRSTELLFNISVRRNFINAFITNILPVIIILALLFHVLLITPKTEHYMLAFAGGPKSEGAGGGGSPTYTLIATSMVLGYTSALLFAVILAHSRLRTEIPADGILYLEYFYFSAYFSILAVTTNVLGFAAHRGGWLIHFRENLIPRVAYWPLVTMFLFIVSFVTFF